MHQQQNSSYAEIRFSKTCFGLKPRHKSTICVLNEADAASRVQDEIALLWVDLSKESIFLTERWGSDAVCHKLPVRISVKKEGASKANQEVPVTSLAFSERSSAEHYGKVALNLLPEWLLIRRSTTARSLLVLTDHWIVTEAEQALKLQHPAGHLQVLLQLDVGQACIQAVLIQERGSCKTYQVSCLADVTKLLRKHSKPQERLEKVVHTVLQELKPSASSVGRLLARLEAAAMGHKGVPSIAQWCRGGVMAALVDTAAALGRASAPTGKNERSKGGHRHSTPGGDGHSIQQQSRSVSMPGAAPVQAACDSTADLATLQALAECCAVVMQYGTPAGEQAELLAACVSRALMGSLAEAVCALQLLHMVLRHLGPLNKSPACMQLHKACCDPQLLHQLEHCFSRAVTPQQQQQQLKSTDEQHLLLSHQLEGLSPDGASEPTTPIGGQHGLQEQASGVSADLGSLSDSPTATPRSSAGFFLRRQSLVPKLHLPVPVTPAPNSCSRLSVQSTAQAMQHNTSSSFSSTDRAAGAEQKAAAPSYLRALQQLGRSCGQSVMAADLAAFVTHKQLLGGVVALESTLQHSRHPATSSQQDTSSCQMPANKQIGFDQSSGLPVPTRLHVMLLEVLSLLADMPGSELVLPKPWEHLLLSPLLAFKSTWLHCGGGVSAVGAGREHTLLEGAYSRVRALTLQLVQHSSHVRRLCPSARGSTAVNAGLTSSAAWLHESVLEQFKARLAACSMEGRAVSARMHDDCAELLLLLRGYLHMSQQPQLADTACFMLGGVLAQQEHMLRATRMEHWPLEAVLHMDALVQLHTQLLGQVSSPAAAAWLLAVLGVQATDERTGCGAAGTISSSPHPSTPVPADTLQLLLDYLQTHLAALAAAADSHSTAAQSADATAATPVSVCPASTQKALSGRVNSKRPADGASGGGTNSLHGLLPSWSAVQQVHSTRGSADAFVMQLRANCWNLLNHLLLLAHRQPTSRPHEVFGSPLHPKVSSSSHRDVLQRPGDVTPGSQGRLVHTSPPKGIPQSGLSARSAAAAAQQPSEEAAAPPSQSMRPSLPLLSTPNSCSTSSTPSASGQRGSNDGVSLSNTSRTPSGLLAAQCRPGGFPSGCCSIWQVLIELLMVNSSMGQATALQHMAETNGNRLLLPLQRAVTEFLSTALGTPDSYAFTKPQLAEFYVHHHFLHFTQNYHKLPTSTASAALCKSHLQVLLALCRHTGGAHQVRRRFLQLKVLEFIVREASLEYMCLHNQLAASPSSSSCSTPLSTSRTAASYRTSAQDAMGPAGITAAAAGTPTDTAAHELANGGSGLGPSWELSSANARGLSSSRLWVSSPGCHLSARSARSAQHTQRSCSSRGRHSNAEGVRQAEQQARTVLVSAALAPLQSYAVEGLCNDMGELLLTGSSCLLTGTGSLPAGWSAADAGPSSSSRASAAGSQPGRQPSIKLGSKVKAAVEALESAAAAVSQQPQPLPQPPSTACPPAAAAGRRQPGQQRLVGVGEPGQAACSPQVPKLKLPTSCHPADINPGSGSRQSPQASTVAWQQLEPPAAAAAAAGGSAASPRADIAGYEVPASVRSQRRIKQPQLTGDASLDNIIIDSWERRTGLEYQFDDFGADVEAANSVVRSSRSSSEGSACQAASPSGCQPADATVQPAAGNRSALRPQTPAGLAALAALGPTAGNEQVWAPPHFDLGPVPGSSRWISSSDTVEDAAPVSVTQILREGHRHITGCDASRASNSVGADRPNGSSAVAAAANVSPGKVQVPRLCMGSLQGEQRPLADSSRALSTPHSPCSTGGSPGRSCGAQSPGSYKPGFDLEEDFERLMAAGDWDDSDSDAGSEQSTQPGADASGRSPRSPHSRAYAAAQAPPSQPCHQQQQEEPASLEHGCSSPDVQAAADVHSSKAKAHRRGKKQAVVAGSSGPVVAELSAHALADVSGSSSDGSQYVGNSSDSEVDSDSGSDVPWPVGPSPTRAPAVVIPRLNLPQLQQPSWHLPMADTALLTGASSEAALSSSYRTSITSASRGTPLTVMPLTTGRLTTGAADSSRGRATNAAGIGQHSSQLSGRLGSSARGQTRLSHLLEPCADAGQAGGAPCTPSTTAAVGPSQGPYAAHRAKCAVYMDLELHALCMELALHLLVTPNGQLDPVQLPHEPTDVSLQRKVMLLLQHLSHPANLGMACVLAQRACSILRQQQQQQDPCALLRGSRQPAASQQPSSRAGTLDSIVLGSAHSGGSSAASQQDLQEALRAVWHDDAYQLARAGRTCPAGAGSEGSSGLASTADQAADAAKGLAVSSLRLLKLLCAPVLDMRRLDVGGMINKGAFSEIMAGMYYAPGGSAPMAVALKVMDCSQDDACSFERVYNEVVTLEVLHGKPHVIPLLEYGVTSAISGTRQWVLVFPRYASSLREWRTKWAGKGLHTQDLPVYLSLFLQVAHAVAVLHSSNVVHFDIKGDNVLLQHGFDPASLDQPSSSSSRPSADIVLADFGDALMLENAHASSQRHRGTELFSSPEMLLLHAGRQHAHHAQHDRRKHRGVHAAHDVWSLGCTLYELLTGSVLFEDEGVGRITSYSSSQSSGGGAHSLRPDARGWGVLNAREKAALQHHTGCVELVESMLVGEPNWRPTAEQVVHKTQRLLASLHL